MGALGAAVRREQEAVRALHARLALVVLLLAAGACDPCAGTASCRTGARISYTGHIVERTTARSVPGTDVTFTRTSGIELSDEPIHAVSDADGFFRLRAGVTSSGDVIGTLHVAPPNRPAYDVAGITMHTTEVAGDGGDLGRIVSDPFIMFVAEVHNRVPGHDAIVPYASVTFRRTGGIAIDPAVIQLTADANGRFFLAPIAAQAGAVAGIITINGPGFPNSYDIPVQIGTQYQDVVTRDVNVLRIGTTLLWAGEVFRRGTNGHTAGIQVDFQRTAGIDVVPAQFTTTTNDIGLFPIQPAPIGEGELVGTVTIHSPAPFAPVIVPNVRVHTVADDSVRLAGRWGYGSQVFGAIELIYRTTMSRVDSGATVIFRRTGGVQTLSDSAVTRVNQFGAAGLQLASNAAGDAVGDFEVQLGEPYGTEIIRGVHVASAEDDIQRFYGTHAVGRWFPQVAQVVDSVTRQAIPGTIVRFTREDGIGTTPDPYIVTPNADGYFALRPQPLSDGEVVGTITFQLPAPYASVNIRGVHLRTSMDDTLRFIGTFAFLRPR